MAKQVFGIKDTKFFFDSDLVKKALTSFQRRVLLRTGAYGQAVINNSLKQGTKRRRTQSGGKVGRAPFYNVRPGLKDNILFAYSPLKKSVVIAPRLFRSKHKQVQRINGGVQITKPVSKTVIELIETGGRAVRQIIYNSGTSKTLSLRYRSFPYVNPALDPTIRRMKRFVREEEF